MISSKKGKQKYIRNYCFCLSERSKKINKTVFSTSSKKAKTSELLQFQSYITAQWIKTINTIINIKKIYFQFTSFLKRTNGSVSDRDL